MGLAMPERIMSQTDEAINVAMSNGDTFKVLVRTAHCIFELSVHRLVVSKNSAVFIQATTERLILELQEQDSMTISSFNGQLILYYVDRK